MDAQNAAGSSQTRPVSSPSRPPNETDELKTSTGKSPMGVRQSSPIKDAALSGNVANPQDEDAAGETASDAETIVLPGKDGHSPSKARKVKHEEKSDEDGTPGRKNHETGSTLDTFRNKDGETGPGEHVRSGAGGSEVMASPAIQKKRLHEKSSAKSKDGSSGLSSAPTSPPPARRRSRGAAHSDSESEATRNTKSPKVSTKDRDKARHPERLIPHKRKTPRAESEDEAENRKARRQRTSASAADFHTIRPAKEPKLSSKPNEIQPEPGLHTRSISPHPRIHRRSISTQLPSQASNGLSQKKKRVPAPLQSTDYHSDDSSASGSPHPRSSKLRSLATPATADSTISPAKMAPHKKHLDAHGQTFLARACARGEYEVAKQRLAERPEDLNVADYAGNTPLQIAAINGCEDIVKLLVEAGCNLDCVNYDKDTPLLDAVDNGHLGVIKLLLDAGVNPRKANVNGEEPIDRVRDDMENAPEIRAALHNAKQRMGERRRTSEDHQGPDYQDNRDSHGPESPRQSPVGLPQGAPGSRRSATVRSTKTSHHLLYMPMDDKTLRNAAGKGDEATVTRILQVRDGCDDHDSMVAAARGGHDLVMQLLLALGGANPDPPPISSHTPEFATPILAAIGQENLKVIRLLLDQANFDPTRRFKGETYYEIARRRQGTNWKEEEHLLKEAYDEYKKSRDVSKTKSPNRKERERERVDERDSKRITRNEGKDEANKAHKRNLSSPSRENEPRKKLPGKPAVSPKEKRRSDSVNLANDQGLPKRGPGRPKKEERATGASAPDREKSPLALQKPHKAKRAESDVAGASSDGEAIKPRRKLISKAELKGAREKQRRTSLVSGASSLKDPSSPQDSRHDDPSERPKGEAALSEKYHDRTKALRRDQSKDRLSASGENATKRHRSSVTPPHLAGGDKDESGAPIKRRRLDADGKERRQKVNSSPEGRHPKINLSRDPSTKTLGKPSHKEREDDIKPKHSLDTSRRESGKSTSSEKSIHVKSEDADVDMADAPLTQADDTEARAQQEMEKKRRAAELEEVAREEQKRQEAAERKKLEEEELKKREEEDIKRKEEEKKRLEEEERKRIEAEERRRLEEEERRHREEEEKRRVEEEERKRKEEEARLQREEEERLRREQLEREAAEEARRKREEEERRERERKRAAKEAEQRRIFEEQERIRLAKLPPLLRWLDTCPNPKTPEFAAKFKYMQGVRYDTIHPEATGTPDGREQWVLNTQVALLLGEKDLGLSRYTAWERRHVSYLAKRVIWRIESDRYALTSRDYYDLGLQLPAYYGEGVDPKKLSYVVTERLRGEAWDKFRKMDMFFVKVSDLMYHVPSIPHLRAIKLAVDYRELPAHEDELIGWKAPQKWKSDPDADRFFGFAPRNKYYINGAFVDEEKPGFSATSSTPFPEKKVPRRFGLYQVYPHEPDYAQVCKEQGLEHLLGNSTNPLVPNGIHSPSASPAIGPPSALHLRHQGVNGTSRTTPTPTPMAITPTVESATIQRQPLLNGIKGGPSPSSGRLDDHGA